MQTLLIFGIVLFVSFGNVLAQEESSRKTDVRPESVTKEGLAIAAQVGPSDTPKPVMTPELAQSYDDIDAIPVVDVDVRIRVVDAADGQPIEGAKIIAWPDGRTLVSDREGVVLMPRGRQVGPWRRIGIGIERGIYRGNTYDRNTVQVMQLSKNGVPLDTSRLVLEAISDSVPVLAPPKGPVDVVIRLDLSGKVVNATVKFPPPVDKHGKPIFGKSTEAIVIVDAGPSFDPFEVDIASGSFRFGPVPVSMEAAYLRFGGVAVPLRADDGVHVSVPQIHLLFSADVEYRNIIQALIQTN